MGYFNLTVINIDTPYTSYKAAEVIDYNILPLKAMSYTNYLNE